MRAKAASRWRVAPRRDRIRRIARDRLGTTTDIDLAKHLGLTPSSLCLMLSGKTQPSGPVIAMFVTALDEPFDGLFAIERIVARSEHATAA